MPRLLPFDALDGPPVRARWTAILTVALAITAWNTDWNAALNTTRGLAPAQIERHDWNTETLTAAPEIKDRTGLTEGIDDPAGAETARLEADGVVLELIWEAALELDEVRLESYRDLFGTGFRLGIAADSTTRGGPNCVNARITRDGKSTLADWCSRSDQHEPVDMASFLGKEDDGGWKPDQLYVTQTANFDPPNDSTLYQIDYYGLGIETGDAFESGLWPVGYWIQGENLQTCNEPGKRERLDDLHLTDRYDDPEAHQRTSEYVYGALSAFPEEGRLLVPGCVRRSNTMGHDIVTEPFLSMSPTPLAGVAPYNASTREVRPLRTAFVIDLRTCDADPVYCSSDEPDDHAQNTGAGAVLMNELLDTGR